MQNKQLVYLTFNKNQRSKWKLQLLQFKSNNMKSINQFDYPSKDAQSFKANSQLSDSLDNKDIIKARYKENLQYHMELERNKAKLTQKNKKQHESKKKQQQLHSELQQKIQQLHNLQILKVQAQQNQKKAYQSAALKQQQDLIKKQQEKKRKIQFDQDATIRFSEAIKKLHQQKQEQSFKQRLAEQRRKTAQQFQKLQRSKAEKFRQVNEEKQKIQQKQNKSATDEYRKTFKQFFYSPNQDYNRTCVHNLKVVPEVKKEQNDAIQRGKIQQNETRQKSEQRKRQLQENDRKSKERGRDALLKMQRERQYENFEKETSEEQKKYNLERIEAGKRNQFVGVKPTTLNQMQVGKKMRSQEEFDKMFYAKSVQPAESASQTATKYEIVQKRVPRRNDDEDEEERPRQVKSYLRQKQESQIPAVSEGKYSFEQKCYSQFKNQSRSQSNIHEETQENQEEYQEENQEGYQDDQNQEAYAQTNTKNNALKQTRIPGYEKTTNSPQQPKKPQLKQVKNEFSKQKQKLQDEPFDTDAMLRKYGLKRENSERQKADKGKNQAKPQSKRKVVELSNVCQNRQQQKEELNYSSESEEDSLT